MAKTESCVNCVYSCWDRNQAMWTMGVGVPTRPTCANHPNSLGRNRPTPGGGVCRNYRPRPAEAGCDAKQIPLGDGYYAYVDAADYEWLSQWTWYLHNGYAARHGLHGPIYMHREIMQPPKGMIVDHKHRNKLDNTRDNLRNCTYGENARNTAKKRGASSRFRGVGYCKKYHKWYARIYRGGKCFFLGYFVDEVEAARAYDRKAVELFGEFARLNFPEEWPAQRRREVCEKRV